MCVPNCENFNDGTISSPLQVTIVAAVICTEEGRKEERRRERG